jgi:hypothetical protein
MRVGVVSVFPNQQAILRRSACVAVALTGRSWIFSAPHLQAQIDRPDRLSVGITHLNLHLNGVDAIGSLNAAQATDDEKLGKSSRAVAPWNKPRPFAERRQVNIKRAIPAPSARPAFGRSP